MLSRELELALIKAIKEAKAKKHEYVTVEHMLWGLLHDDLAVHIISKCGGDNNSIRERLREFLADPDNPNYRVEDLDFCLQH